MTVRKLLCATAFLGMGLVPAMADEMEAARKAMAQAVVEAAKVVSAEEMAEHGGFPEAMKPLALDFLRDLYSDEKVVEMLAHGFYYHVPHELRDDLDAAHVLIRNYAATVADEHDRTGIQWLPVEDQRKYLQMQDEILSSMSAEDCADKVIMKRKTAEERMRIELGVVQEKGDEYAKTWFDLKKAAIKAQASAEAEGRSSQDLMSEADYVTGRDIIEERWKAMLNEDPRGAEIFRAHAGSRDATNEDHCAYWKIHQKAALSLEGTIGDIAVRVVSTYPDF